MTRLNQAERRSLTRSRLRAAGRKEIARSGVGGASIDQIAEAAGYSRGAFYANYKSKHELLLELVAEAHEEEISRWRAMVGAAQSLDEMFAEMAERFDAFVAERDWWVLNVELLLEAERDPGFRKVHARLRAKTNALVHDLVRSVLTKEGMQAPISEGVVGDAAMALRALAEGLATEARRGGSFKNRSPGEIFAAFLRRLAATYA